MPPESCHISGGGRSLEIRKNFKTEDEKVMSHPRSLEYRNKECSCASRLCHLFTVSLGYFDQSALGSNGGFNYALVCRCSVQRQCAGAAERPAQRTRKESLGIWTIRSPLGPVPDELFSHFVELICREQPGIVYMLWRPRASDGAFCVLCSFDLPYTVLLVSLPPFSGLPGQHTGTVTSVTY